MPFSPSIPLIGLLPFFLLQRRILKILFLIHFRSSFISFPIHSISYSRSAFPSVLFKTGSNSGQFLSHPPRNSTQKWDLLSISLIGIALPPITSPATP